MRELTLIIQTSLDGFVASPNGEFDKFLGGEENLGFVCSITEDADTILLGRASYELLNTSWPSVENKPCASSNEIKYSRWYNSSPKYVLSTTLTNATNANVISINPDTEINRLKHQPGKSILVFGSPTAAHYLFNLNLINNFWVIVHPVIFGEGIPFFRDRKNTIKLHLVASKQLSNGTLCNKYSVNK
jgi:dihydrofolate reductase